MKTNLMKIHFYVGSTKVLTKKKYCNSLSLMKLEVHHMDLRSFGAILGSLIFVLSHTVVRVSSLKNF